MISFLVLVQQDQIPQQNIDFIRSYNAKYSKDRTYLDYFLDSPFLIRQFIQEVRDTNGMALIENNQIVVYMLTAFFYVLSPFDMIPEIVFGVFGFADDMAIVVLVVIATTCVMMTMLNERNNEQLNRNR